MYAQYISKLASVVIPETVPPDVRGVLQSFQQTMISILGGCKPLGQHGVTDVMADFGQKQSGVSTGALNATNTNNYGQGYALTSDGGARFGPGITDNSIVVQDNSQPTPAIILSVDPYGSGTATEPWNFNGGMQLGGDGVSTGNLLENPNFENGLNNADSPPDLWSGGGFADHSTNVIPNEGTWSMGTTAASCYQEIDVSKYKTAIDAGNEIVRLKAATYQSTDGSITPASIGCVFTLDDATQQSVSLTTDNTYYLRTKNFWRYYDGTFSVPSGTRKMKFFLNRSGSNFVDECYMGLESVFDPDNNAGLIANGNNVFNGDAQFNGQWGPGANGAFVPNLNFVRQQRRRIGLAGN